MCSMVEQLSHLLKVEVEDQGNGVFHFADGDVIPSNIPANYRWQNPNALDCGLGNGCMYLIMRFATGDGDSWEADVCIDPEGHAIFVS